MAKITKETRINWKYCPKEENLAGLGGGGASIHRMETGGWLTGLEWLCDEKHWPVSQISNVLKTSTTKKKPSRKKVSTPRITSMMSGKH